MKEIQKDVPSSNFSSVTVENAAEHGLSADEYHKILSILGRTPNLVELGIFSVMWSEHCSYKSTRLHLKKFPTTAPWVICGPGENAGVIDIEDDDAIIFKMESHNHPSFIEPYQGAATGVGGILRDVFTMGARPIANLNALRFGSLEHPKTRFLLNGVVAGIGGYGNCVGVPTVGGECQFHPSYNGNILVNAMSVGLAKKNKIFYSAATSVGSPVVYVGSKTGRDGIHGATMASAEFDDESDSKRPTVQVGDPFAEKLLIEACLELMESDAILSIQDMGAAGLTCSSLEMAGKGGTGIELHLEQVPVRETGMTPYEIMLSESQERMLMVLKPEKTAAAQAIFEKWGLDFAVIGKITNTGKLVLFMEREQVAELPIEPLSENAPIYDRPWVKTAPAAAIDTAALKTNFTPIQILLKLLALPDLCSKRWIWEQYDSMVMNDTVFGPGGDASLIRIHHHASKAVALTADCTPRYCVKDPFEGGKQAVAETWRNLTAVGSQPLAITNCLNFGNPEKPEIMGQLVGCIEGMSEACKALDFPVVSGNVSLYNETNGDAIFPTPAVGGVGLLKDLSKKADIGFKQAEQIVMLIGQTKGHLGSSLYASGIMNQEIGSPPPVDLTLERKNGDFVRELIQTGLVNTCHDLSDGGLLVALTEMTLPHAIGINITIPQDINIPVYAYLFGEDQARYVIAIDPKMQTSIQKKAQEKHIPISVIGTTGGSDISILGEKISISELRTAHENTLPAFMTQTS